MGSRSKLILELCKTTLNPESLTTLEKVVFQDPHFRNELENEGIPSCDEVNLNKFHHTPATLIIPINEEAIITSRNESGIVVYPESEGEVNNFHTEQGTLVIPITEDNNLIIHDDPGIEVIPASGELELSDTLHDEHGTLETPITEDEIIDQFQNEPGTIVIPVCTEDFIIQKESENVSIPACIQDHNDHENVIIPSTGNIDQIQLLNEHLFDNDDQIEIPTENIKICKRKRVADPEKWKKNRSKALRMKGQEYLGYSTEKGTVKHNKPRSSRNLKSGCENNRFCTKSAKRNCSSFTEEKREELFNLFWNMSWEQKKIYVLGLVLYLPKKRSYVQGASRRSGTFIYHLRLDSKKLQVCKKMFLSTFDLKEKMVHNWILNNQNHGFAKSVETKNHEKTAKRNRTSFHLKCKAQSDFVKTFFNRMPKMESHYCRKDTNKLYFQHPFKTKTEIYEIYKTTCENENQSAVSSCSFNKIFDAENLSIYQPRKDQCDLCCQYRVKQLSEDEYQIHIKKKIEAQEEKKRDKEDAIKGINFTFTMDVQAVKLCPVIEASSMYYKTRLQVHNFTIYNIATHQCTNYVWNESEGDLQSSVFVSCIISHLEKYCLDDKRDIILYSDGCGYQNRNSTLSNALSYFAFKNGVTIQQKFLEKGHTQMECDSTHALIERRLKGRDITLPCQYATIIRESRKKPFPLDVQYLSYDFFKNYDDKLITRYESIRPGKMKNDPTVCNLRCLKYQPDGKILFKINYHDDYDNLPQRQKFIACSNDINLKPLFEGRLPIKATKWKHLQEMKKCLDRDVHAFYDNLPYLQYRAENDEKIEDESSNGTMDIGATKDRQNEKNNIRKIETTKRRTNNNKKVKQSDNKPNVLTAINDNKKNKIEQRKLTKSIKE